MGKYAAVLRAEAKKIGKDSILMIFALYPILLVLIGKVLIPYLQKILLSPAFDLREHYPAILVFFILMPPYAYGAMAGFLLLDEREDNVLQAVRVTPLTLPSYIGIKVFFVMAASMITGIFLVFFLNLVPMRFFEAVILNLILSFAAPFEMLLINNFAKNKVEGFAVIKASGILLILPIAVFYIPQKYRLLGGIVPGYWPAMAIGRFFDSSFGYMSAGLFLLIGFMYILLLNLLLYRIFRRRLLSV